MIQENKQNSLTIEIPFEEYKELLIIKGKYEELKSQTFHWDSQPMKVEPYIPTIVYYDNPPNTPWFESIKITC